MTSRMMSNQTWKVPGKGKSKLPGIRRFLRDYGVPLIAFVMFFSFVLGVIGFLKYIHQNGSSPNLLYSLYSSLALFVFEGGNVQPPIPWELEVARFLSPIAALYAAVLGFLTLFHEQLKVFYLRLWKNHVIVCGLGEKGLNIAKDFCRNGFRVVAVEKDPSNPNIAHCRELGAVVLAADATDEIVLRKVGLIKARYLIAVSGDDSTNADIAVLSRKISQHRKTGNLNCTVHIQDADLWSLLRKQEFSRKPEDTFRLDIFNIYDQGSKQLFREFPLNMPTSETLTTPHLLIVGFGDFSEQLILNAARSWSPYFNKDRRKLQISLVDPQAESHIHRLCQESSLVKHVCTWNLYPFDTDSEEFLKGSYMFNKGNQLDISMIFITIENETISLRTALMLLDQIHPSRVRVLVRMKEEQGLASLIREADANDNDFVNLYMFGLMERTCKMDLLFNSTHEAIARTIHAEYLHEEELKGHIIGSSQALVDWNLLPEDLKEMNRAQADSILVKLQAIHCDIIPWRDHGADGFAFTSDEVEILARLEHERWANQKQQQGWRFASVRNNQKKEHPSLVSWDDPDLSEDEKLKDQNTIHRLPRYLAMAGYQIYRLNS